MHSCLAELTNYQSGFGFQRQRGRWRTNTSPALVRMTLGPRNRTHRNAKVAFREMRHNPASGRRMRPWPNLRLATDVSLSEWGMIRPVAPMVAEESL